MRVLKFAILLFSMFFASLTMAGVRDEHWSGFDFTTGMPFPSLYGFMLGFNVGDDARVSSGIGSFVHWISYDIVDAKFFLSDGEWAPYMGAGLSYMVGEHAQYLIWDFQFDRAFVPYFQGGIDFQSSMGVHVMFNLAGSAPNGRVIVLPGLAIGWYF